MRNPLISLLPLACLTVASCTAVPDQSDVTGIETVDVINRIRCETKAAIANYPDIPVKVSPDYSTLDTRYNPIIITYTFEFISEENNNLSAGATYVMPIHLGTLTVGLGAGTDRTRRGTDKIVITETFAELRQFPCENTTPADTHRYPILGTLGIERVIWTYFRLMPLAAGSKEFDKTLFFKLKKNAGVKPSVSIVPVPGRKLDANVDAKADRSDSHEATITLKAEKKKEEKELTDEQKIWEKTVYVRFLDAFDDQGRIKRGPGGPPRKGEDEREDSLPAPPKGPASARDDIERAKERAQQEAIDNRNARELRRLRRDLLNE